MCSNETSLNDVSDIWCFWHFVYMSSNWFSSLYRFFLILFDSLQVWSCTWGKIDHLEQKGQKKCNLKVFTQSSPIGCSRSSGATRVSVPAAEIFMETSNISEFTVIIPILSPAAARDLQYIFSYFLLFYYAVSETRNQTWAFGRFVIWDFVKGEGSISLTTEKITWNPLFISFINMQYYSELISVFSLVMTE